MRGKGGVVVCLSEVRRQAISGKNVGTSRSKGKALTMVGKELAVWGQQEMGLSGNQKGGLVRGEKTETCWVKGEVGKKVLMLARGKCAYDLEGF